MELPKRTPQKISVTYAGSAAVTATIICFFVGIPSAVPLVLAGTAAFYGVLSIVIRRDDQRDRDQFARETLAYLNSNGPSTKFFSLYLRPFALDRRVKLGAQETSDEPSDIALEGLIAEALDTDFPLIMIGNSSGVRRPGSINPGDTHWQSAFFTMAKAAKCIIALPLAQRSTVWEITQLKELGLLEKTIFVWPPSAKFQRGNRTDSFAAAMELSRAHYSTQGLHFPRVGARGAAFRFRGDGSYEVSEPLAQDPVDLFLQIRRLLPAERSF